MLTQTLQYHLSLAISLIPPLLGDGSPAGATQAHGPQTKAVREAGTGYPGDSGSVSWDRDRGLSVNMGLSQLEEMDLIPQIRGMSWLPSLHAAQVQQA